MTDRISTQPQAAALPGKGITEGFAVVCHGVTRSYGQGAATVKALRGVDLEVRRGELMMLVGPSGCGKTTLISVMAAILDADGGQCTVLDHDLGPMSQSEKTAFRRRSIGFVFQAYNLLPTLTAAENVAIPLLIQGWRETEALQQAAETLTSVGLGDRIRSRPDQLSGGQQQRVAVARALVHQPQLIVCDEPTSALDHRTGYTLMTALKQLALEGDRSLVIVTHDPRIFAFADRIAEMDDGRIIALGSPDEIQALAAVSLEQNGHAP